MANKIYTKTGDKGSTSLIDGSRVSKSDARIEALGSLDEANAFLGSLAVHLGSAHSKYGLLVGAQSLLFACGARLAEPTEETKLTIVLPTAEDVAEYEESIDAMTKELPLLTRFILPGGCEGAARAHVARAIIRRAERSVVGLREAGAPVESEMIQLLNRLSDWLFTLARLLNHEASVDEVVWGPV